MRPLALLALFCLLTAAPAAQATYSFVKPLGDIVKFLKEGHGLPTIRISRPSYGASFGVSRLARISETGREIHLLAEFTHLAEQRVDSLVLTLAMKLPDEGLRAVENVRVLAGDLHEAGGMWGSVNAAAAHQRGVRQLEEVLSQTDLQEEARWALQELTVSGQVTIARERNFNEFLAQLSAETPADGIIALTQGARRAPNGASAHGNLQVLSAVEGLGSSVVVYDLQFFIGKAVTPEQLERFISTVGNSLSHAHVFP